jgi:hypothetical protein
MNAFPGVRPSPVAATPARMNAHELTQRLSTLHPAAPENGRTPSPLTELSALIASGLGENSVTSGYGIGQPVVGQSPKLSVCDRPRSQQRPHA